MSLEEFWLAWMAPMLWQSSLLILAVLLADLLLRRWAWPQLRRALWLMAALKLMLPPSLTSPVGVAPRLIEGGLDGPIARAGSSAPAAPAWLPWVWIAGVVVFGLIAALRSRRARRIWMPRGATSASTGGAATNSAPPGPLHRLLGDAANRLRLRRLPRLALSPTAPVPAVCGLFRPMIVLPAGLPGQCTNEELSHIFLHELAHLRRKDLWVEAALRALHLVYWFHPLFWLVRRHEGILREICCDANVAAILRDRSPAYRETLLRTVARMLDGPPPAPSAAFFGEGARSGIAARLRWLERGSWRNPHLRRAAALTLALLLLVGVLPMAAAAAPAPLRAPARTAALEELNQVFEKARTGEVGCLQLRYAAWMLIAEQRREP